MAKGVVMNAKQVLQIRVIPELKWPFNKHPVYYDSAVLFTTPQAAKAATGPYIADLIEQKLLNDKQPYTVEILILKVIDIPIESRSEAEEVYKQFNSKE